IALNSGDYKKAKMHHEMALQYAHLCHDTLSIVISMNYLGSVSLRMEKTINAMNYFTDALRIAEKKEIVDQRFLGSISFSNTGIGYINFLQGQYPKARECLSEALDVAKRSNNLSEICHASQFLGLIYERINKPYGALKLYKMAIAIAQRHKSNEQLGILMSSIGRVYIQLGDYPKAINYFKEASRLFIEKYDKINVANSYLDLGHAYLHEGNKNLSQAALSKGIELSKNIHYKLLVAKGYNLLASLYESNGNYQKALEYYKLSTLCNDSLQHERNVDLLTEIQYKYDSEKKEHQIQSLRQERLLQSEELSRRQLYMFITFGLSLMILILITFLSYHQKLKTRHKQAVLEQQLLRSQMNPHFIFNSLVSIQNFTYKNEGQKASYYLGVFATLTRSVLNNSRKELITLSEELKTLESYLALQKMRFDFDYNIERDNDLDIEEVMLPPMMIQPFVENSVNHGVCRIDERGNIEVFIKKEDNHLQIEILDNGPGISHAKPNEISPSMNVSFGLKMFEDRMQNVRSLYKGEFGYQFADLGEQNPEVHGTKITFWMPLKWVKWI
ncbi:MAG: tetratricopeptide repeat protein, partial [Bacteroidota bacterium]|nr:tetratricopeptide repeat protein [Bacteroidota bacterium]